MKTKSIKTLVARLKRLNAACARLQVRRDRIPCKSVWLPTPELAELQSEINKLCGEAMQTERCIINALLREESK